MPWSPKFNIVCRSLTLIPTQALPTRSERCILDTRKKREFSLRNEMFHRRACQNCWKRDKVKPPPLARRRLELFLTGRVYAQHPQRFIWLARSKREADWKKRRRVVIALKFYGRGRGAMNRLADDRSLQAHCTGSESHLQAAENRLMIGQIMVPGSYCPTAAVFVPLEHRGPGKSRNLTKAACAQSGTSLLRTYKICSFAIDLSRFGSSKVPTLTRKHECPCKPRVRSEAPNRFFAPPNGETKN